MNETYGPSTLKYCRGVWVFCTGNCKDCEFTATGTSYGNYDLKWVAQTELTEECITKIAKKVADEWKVLFAKNNDITQCKDCKYSNRRSDGKYWCRDHGEFVEDDGYCSWGERRKNNGF